jgi:hypothetical protein
MFSKDDPNLTFDRLLSCKPALYPPAGFKQASI